MRDENGVLFSLLAAWTDAGPADPFVVVAAGRCPFRLDDLLAVAAVVDRLQAQPGHGTAVKGIAP